MQKVAKCKCCKPLDKVCCACDIDLSQCAEAASLLTGKYSERAFQALDYILDEAAKVGVRLILTMTDNWSPVDSKAQVTCLQDL